MLVAPPREFVFLFQKVQIVCVTSPSLDTTLTHGDLPRSGSSQGSCSSAQSSKSELGGLVDLLTVDNGQHYHGDMLTKLSTA